MCSQWVWMLSEEAMWRALSGTWGFPSAGTMPYNKSVSLPQKKCLTALHCTADHCLLFPPAFAGHHSMFHPHRQGEVVTQPLMGTQPIHDRYLGSLAAIEPIDEAAVLAVVHWEPCSPVCRGARHRQQVNLSWGSTYQKQKESGVRNTEIWEVWGLGHRRKGWYRAHCNIPEYRERKNGLQASCYLEKNGVFPFVWRKSHRHHTEISGFPVRKAQRAPYKYKLGAHWPSTQPLS